ncbi:MAG: hypothetical protein Q9227_001090 [Pyrenula ochraceoflavens]
MADPLSAAAGVAGLIGLGIQVTQLLCTFYTSYKNQDSNVNTTFGNLETLLQTLDSLKTALEDYHNRYRDDKSSLDVVHNAVSSIESCRENIKELEEECDKVRNVSASTTDLVFRVKAAGRRLAYPFRKSTLEKIEENIGEIRANISLALDVLHLQSDRDSRNDIAEVKAVLSLIEANQISWTLRASLKAPDVSVDHNTACAKRHPDTGKWLLGSAEFQTWLHLPNSFLWLHGFAGCGKTVLCSTAIQRVCSHRNDNTSIGISFFYFTFRDESKQSASSMLRAVVLQLVCQLNDGHNKFNDLLTLGAHGTPSNKDLSDYLRQLVGKFGNVYLILDALDESPRGITRNTTLDVIETIRQWALPQLHLLVTSRDEVDIRDALLPDATEDITMNNEGIDEDIKAFLKDQFQSNRRLRKNWLHHQEKIQQALTEGAHGIFRWVECQLISLQSCPRSEEHLDRALHSLPPSLDATYERMLCSIDPSVKEDARRLLTLLCFTGRPTTVSELIDGMAIELGSEPHLNKRRRLQGVDDFFAMCAGLIDIEATFLGESEDSDLELRIAHFSVQEYLESDRIREHGAAFFYLNCKFAHQQLTQICLVYLLDGPLASSALTEAIVAEYPLTSYAAEYWYLHNRQSAEDGERTLCSIELLFERQLAFQNWILLFDPDWKVAEKWRQGSGHRLPSPLYYASLLGLGHVQKILVQKGVDVNAVEGYWGNALHAASKNGHKESVEILLRSGADANATGRQFSSALDAAYYARHNEIVQLLLQHGADQRSQPNPACGYPWGLSGPNTLSKPFTEGGIGVGARFTGSSTQAAGPSTGSITDPSTQALPHRPFHRHRPFHADSST